MASSKIFLLLGLAFALVLLISSDVSAIELHETVQAQDNEQVDKLGHKHGQGHGHGHDHKHGHHHGKHHGHRGHHGHHRGHLEAEDEN